MTHIFSSPTPSPFTECDLRVMFQIQILRTFMVAGSEWNHILLSFSLQWHKSFLFILPPVEVICRELKKNQCFDALGDTRLDGSSSVRSGQETSFEERCNEGSLKTLGKMPEDREELVRAVREGRRVLSVETFNKKVESRGGGGGGGGGWK